MVSNGQDRQEDQDGSEAEDEAADLGRRRQPAHLRGYKEENTRHRFFIAVARTRY